MEPLVERMLGDQRLEASDQVAVMSGGELGVDRQLERAEAQLLERPDRRCGEGLVGDVGERRSSPQLECVLGSAVGDALLRPGPGALDQGLEPHRVDGAARDLQFVAAAAGDDLCTGTVAGQRLSQPGDVELEVLAGAGR